jgi:PAS domain S-box-containing protein
VQSSDEAIIAGYLDGRITAWNPGAEHLLGYPADEAIGRTIDFLMAAGQEATVRELITRVGRGKQVERCEAQRVRKVWGASLRFRDSGAKSIYRGAGSSGIASDHVAATSSVTGYEPGPTLEELKQRGGIRGSGRPTRQPAAPATR